MRNYRILQGDVRERLRELPSESVHCCVTSPPYWGLRDYGVPGQIGLERTPDCGQREYLRLRRDLTESERAYVARLLLAYEIPDALHGDIHGTE